MYHIVRMFRLSLLTVLAGCTTLVMAGWASAKTTVTFGDKGLSGIIVDGNNLLLSTTPRLGRLRTDADGKMDGNLTGASFDAAGKTLTCSYAWGSMTVTYEPTDTGLRMHTSITNTSHDTIGWFVADLLVLKKFGVKTWATRPVTGLEGPPFVVAGGTDAGLVYSLKQGKWPVEIDVARNNADVGIRISLGGVKPIMDDVPADHYINPGDTTTIDVELEFCSSGVNPYDIAKPRIDAYRATDPQVLHWSDHRPILRLFFNGGLPMEQAAANLKDPDAVKPPEPDAKFQERVLGTMHDAVKAAKIANAQGIIIWDFEGGSFPHPITYIGDPRLIRVLNPQMDLVVDQAVKVLQDAGLKVGVTLRPSRVIYSERHKEHATHSHGVAGDPFTELDAKIKYCKDRWNMQIFYVDTNYFWRQYGLKREWMSGRLTPEMWKKLLAKYPDTLFIPEHHNFGDYNCTAPYGEADMNDWIVEELPSRIWPEAFRVIVIEDADPMTNYDHFVDSVRRGNALMSYAAPNFINVIAMDWMYREAAMLNAGEPDAVKQAAGSQLISLINSKDQATQYFAIRKLTEQPVQSAEPSLMSRAADPKEDWVIRRAAMAALAKVRIPRNEIEPLIPLLMDRKLGFYAAVGEMLAAQGATAVDQIFQRLNTEMQTMLRTGGGGSFSAICNALSGFDGGLYAQRLIDLASHIPEGKHTDVVKRTLLAAVAKIQGEGAEPPLIKALRNPEVRLQAASALVRMKSEKGIEEIKMLIEAAKKSGDQQQIDQLSQGLRAR